MLLMARAQAAAAREDPARGRGRFSLDTWLLTGLLAAGAALRFLTLSSQSYWFDEAQAAHEFQQSFGALASSLTTHETNPPLYFVLGWLWGHVFGTGEGALRSLSAVAGVATIALAYGCGRELVSRRAGIVAAALVTVSPFMIWYSQEAREYMLLAALSATSLLWFARALREPAPRHFVWWAVWSALALLTHFFAAFLVWPEAVWLVVVHRRRAAVLAAAALVAVQAALLPLAFTHATNSLLGFIKATPLSLRLQQVPVAFGLGTLYQSRLVDYGLLGAGVLGAALIVLLVAGAGRAELRGAGAAAGLAAAVLVLPALAALAGHDFYIPRALMPAWIPLAVVVGAAATARHARWPGAALALAVAALFVYGQVRVQSSPQYQRPNWRGVARALGRPSGPRAIVLYDGGLATDPLAFYLPRVPWQVRPDARLRVAELDVVGSAWQQLSRLPAGERLLTRRTVDGFLVVRIGLATRLELTPGQAGARASTLLTPAPADPAVLFQGAA